MRFVLPVVAALLPIVIAPGFLFYFDVTPKLVILLIGVAVGLVLWRGELPARFPCSIAHSSSSGRSRLVSLVVSTAASVYPALSLNGGNWRRFGTGFASRGVAIRGARRGGVRFRSQPRNTVSQGHRGGRNSSGPLCDFAVFRLGSDGCRSSPITPARATCRSCGRRPRWATPAIWQLIYLFVVFAAVGLIRARDLARCCRFSRCARRVLRSS